VVARASSPVRERIERSDQTQTKNANRLSPARYMPRRIAVR
jgi:hypothetical protein